MLETKFPLELPPNNLIMKHIFEINSRVILNEPAELKHNKIIAFLKSLDAPWGIPNDVNIAFPGFNKEFTATVTLNKLFVKGLKMELFYRFRNKLDDDQGSDDRIYIEFDSKTIDYEYLVTTIFPQFVLNFDAYLADIFCDKMIFKVYESSLNKNKRSEIVRIFPISFFDSILCNRAFLMPPEEVVRKLNGQVYKVMLLHNGVFIIADTKPISQEASDEFDIHVKKLLNYHGKLG